MKPNTPTTHKKKEYYLFNVAFNVISPDGKHNTRCYHITADDFPTKGILDANCRKMTIKQGDKYPEKNCTILFFSKLTKSQYDALNDNSEPDPNNVTINT